MARSLLLACLLVVVLTSCSFCWGYTPLKVGLSLSITGNTSRTALGKTVYDGMQFFFDWYAQQPDFVINGSAYRLEFDVIDDGGSLAQVQQNYQTMWDSGSYDYFMGPINSDASTLAFNILDGKTLLVHTAAAADSVSVGSESSYSILPPASNTMSVALLQAHLAGATSFAYIQENSAYQLSVCGGTASLGRSVGMGTAVCTITVPNSLVGITAEMNETFREAVRNISQCDFDVLILCSYWPMVPLMIEEMKSIDFTPKQLLIAPIISAYDTYPDNLWVSGYIIWSDKLAFPADRFYGTPQDFSGNFSKMFGYRPDGYAAIGAAAPLYLMNAVNLSKTVAWPDVSYSMSRLDLQTFWGRVYYAADHKPLIDPPIIQWQLPPINQTIVAPLSGQANELVYPMPTWQERTSDYGWFVYWGDIVMAVLAGVAIGISLLLIVVVVIFHNRDVFRVAQPEFVLLILFGSILCYLAIYTWLYYVTDAGCAALPWLFTTGFSLMFGSLLSKTWRIHRVFNNPKLRTVQVTRWPLLFFIGLLLALTWSLLIPWTIVDPPSAKLEVPDYTRPSQDYVICHLGSVGTGFLIAILCIEGVLLVLAAFIVFQTRNVKYLLFNEAKSIGFAIYNLIIIGAVCVGVVAADLGPTASFWVRTICFLSAAALTVACLMLPKLYYLRKGTDRTTQSGNSFSVRDSHRTTKSSDISLSDTTMNDPSDQVALLQQEIERLRREVQTLRSQQASP